MTTSNYCNTWYITVFTYLIIMTTTLTGGSRRAHQAILRPPSPAGHGAVDGQQGQ